MVPHAEQDDRPRWLPARWAGLLRGRTIAVLTNLVVLSATTNLLVLLISGLVDVEQSSLWFSCVSAAALLFVADMGISYAFSRHLAVLRGSSPRAALGGTGALVLRYFLKRAALPFVILTILLGVYLLRAWGNTNTLGTVHRPEVLIALWVMVSAYTFLAVLAKFLQMANEGLGKLANERLIVSVCQIATFVVAAASLVIVRSILVLPIAYFAGFALQAVLLYRMAQRPGVIDQAVAIEREDLVGLGRESRGLWFLNLATVVSQNVQIMSLAFLATPTSVATFFFLQRLCGGASNFLGIIPIIDRARITAHIENGEHVPALQVMRRNLLIALGSTGMVVTAFVGGILLIDSLHWLRFRIPPVLLAMFAFDLLFSTVLSMLGQYLLAAGRNPLIPWTIACTILTVMLQFLLVPRYAAYGAIAAFIVAQILTTYVANSFFFIRLVRDLRKANA